MGTLLVGMLTVHSRHIKQVRLADEKQTAVELADKLVADWFVSGDNLPADDSGAFPNGEFIWRVERLNAVGGNTDWRTHKIQLTVWSSNHDKPLVTLELLSDSQIQRTDDN